MKAPRLVHEESAQWYERLHRDTVSEATRAEFERWRIVSPERAEAYARLERTGAQLQGVAESPAILALRHEAALRLTRRTSQRFQPAFAAAAALLIVVVAAVMMVFVAPDSWRTGVAAWVKKLGPAQTDYVTGTGERLTATLKDGSQITLDTQSRLQVAFNEAERVVRLKQGQAYFDVAKDKIHPFVVEVQRRRLVAVGTAFDVRLDADRIQVTMVEGTVRVESTTSRGDARSAHPASASGEGATASPPSPSDAPPGAQQVVISAGEQLLIEPGAAEHVRRSDSVRETSWRRGQLIFDGARLGEAVAEVNRYSDTKIELTDPELGDIRISGSFATGEPHVFVEAVTTYFPIEVSRRNSETVALKARRR
jgi:transmembrane sensor